MVTIISQVINLFSRKISQQGKERQVAYVLLYIEVALGQLISNKGNETKLYRFEIVPIYWMVEERLQKGKIDEKHL